MLPGQPEAQNAAHTAEVEALTEIADEVGSQRFDVAAPGTYDVP